MLTKVHVQRILEICCVYKYFLIKCELNISKKMISGIQTALKSAIDVIAPPATPLQDFTYRWKQLMNFYVSHFNDSKLPVECTSIPRHLDHLLQHLLIEEKKLDEPGPCLEYLLQHRLLDLLATLASAETPPGMRLVCLSFSRKLLTRSKHPLLHHASVYGPVQRLIALCNGNLASPIENEEIQFLLSLCFLVCKYPHVTNIVNDSSNVRSGYGILYCDLEKSEIEKVTYVPNSKLYNSNTLFKPLDTQAITIVNPDMFKLCNEHDRSSENSIQCKDSKCTSNTTYCQKSNSSTQSLSSCRDIENTSQSSSPFLQNLEESNLSEFRKFSAYNSTTSLIDNLTNLRLNDVECSSTDSDSKLKNGKHDAAFSSPSSSENSKCLLLDSLKSYVNSADNTIRIRACEGIMVLASLDDPYFAEVVSKSDLADILTKRLEVLYNLIPAHVEPSDIEDIEVTWGLDSPPLTNEQKFPGYRKVASFFAWFDFCNQLTKEAHPDVAEIVAKAIRILFFEKILTPALSAHHAVLVTALISKCLREVPLSPLSAEMSLWLVGQQRHPELPSEWCWPVLQRLIDNCCTSIHELTVESLKLFEEMIDKRDEHILHCLVLMYLNTRAYYDNNAADSAISSWSDEEDEREREKRGCKDISQGTIHSRTLAPSNIHRILNCFLSLVPRQLQTESENSYGRSMEGWEKQYSIVVKDCSLLAWPLEAVSLDDSNTDNGSNRFYMGPFLTMLFDKVANIPRQKYEINIQLTIVICKLALLPHPYLHEFLLNPVIPLIPGQKSLFTCLQRVIKQLISEVPKIADYKNILKDTRLRLYDECSLNDSMFELTNRPKDLDILFESVIMTEEFCKELAAIAYVKYHHSA